MSLRTFVVTSVALFMVTLDNLVVTTALPVIRSDLGASLEELEWTVNGYTLTFAVFLLTGAALGDRFGRRRLFVAGLGLFTLASAAAAAAPTVEALVAARAVQGVGGAIVMPLTLTLLSAAVAPARRGLALGAWGAIGGLAVACGPLVGGVIVDGASWQWIFGVNVPIGLLLLPAARAGLRESYGPAPRLDLRGLVLAAVGMLCLVWGLVRGHGAGWLSPEIVATLALGGAGMAAFIRWEGRAAHPMLPLRFFRNRTFTATNLVSFSVFFGMFGSIFLLAQFLQEVQGYTPLEAGLRTLPWTGMPVIFAPLAGMLSDRIGGRPLLAGGLALQAIGLGWMALVVDPGMSYAALVPPFVLSGIGMAFFFAPVANVILGAVRAEEEGQASGATNAIREIGGVLGVAVLASVFAASGGYRDGAAFVAGLVPAAWVGAGILTAGAAAALWIRQEGVRAASPAGRPVAAGQVG